MTCKKPGVPLRRAQLAGGTRQLIAIPDEAAVDVDREEWDRLAKNVTFVRVDVPARDYVYHYRLVATIVLAEVARQVSRRAATATGRPRRRAPFYDRALELLDQEVGETILLEDLESY